MNESMTQTQKSLLIIRMGNDARVPRNMTGYLEDLASPALSQERERYIIGRLATVIPELAREWVLSDRARVYACGHTHTNPEGFSGMFSDEPDASEVCPSCYLAGDPRRATALAEAE